ncbi:protein DD3-3-like [Lingula anatina]|uniref:Protein DD3-3-like n=1 Tax=Lingula anatina TaxID=7574 RepID=A0A1S3I8T6_LINAN|nr:protein DD3-3-like [Lingula anatina]|eukprot:XP_013394675.1 protein DD3-3-like [Lingula anatina]
MLKLTCILLAVACATADIYMHNPRGSNNRLNERSANRRNANRAFDSQNNNRGGYNVGDKGTSAATTENEQYNMKYFQSSSASNGQSYLTVEWTNQHGCGGNEDTDPHKVNCNMVLQYMCQPDDGTASQADRLRDGLNTNTQGYTRPAARGELKSTYRGRKNNNVKPDRVLQEPHEWYDKCLVRERNKGLFTADQKLKSNSGLGTSGAIYTRQNPNGNRRGYECPEERDYYPYWHPTPWKDIAVLAENASMCNHYQTKSFNVQSYGECVEYYSGNDRRHFSRWNNQTKCESEPGNRWVEFSNFLEKAPRYTSEPACTGASGNGIQYIWAIPYDSPDGITKECLVALKQPECAEAPWTRSNHLGNGRDGVASNYTWVLPHFPSGKPQRCVLRIRYNISTDDFDPYFTNAESNKNLWKGVMSPVEQNPYVEIGAGHSPLRLAINTAQFGRTFQDRSHVFILKPRPAGTENHDIYNLNVRGKRGNIVQVYPAVEYDFIPNMLSMMENDLVHVQWTGSNSHNNGAPGGDGQTGDAGEGTTGTDRNNIVQIGVLDENFPLTFNKTTLWKNAEVKWIYHGKNINTPKNLALNMASSGYYQCKMASECASESAERKTKMNNLLNNAPASYEGALLKLKKGIYHYICSRNNNFTNRSQKGTIIVL